MTMHERAFKILQDALGEFDNLYDCTHPKMEEMYTTLVMNLYDVATKMGAADIAKKYLQDGL